MYRRTMLIYAGAIVAPALVLLWLGIDSFERQRRALGMLHAEKTAAVTEARLREAAQAALSSSGHPMVEYDFVIENGQLLRPRLHAPPPRPSPASLLEAETLELERSDPGSALLLYQKLASTGANRALALSRVARCLAKLGRPAEARQVWRDVGARYPHDRDLSGRPFGIIAALQSGETGGLLEQIRSGRWDLAADQAEYFASELGGTAGPRYAFARELNDEFRHQGPLKVGDLQSYSVGGRRVFYRLESNGRIQGFAVNDAWIARKLRPQVQEELAVAAPRGPALYAAAIALVVVILGAGVLLLLRDISREVRLNRLRSDLVSSVSHELKTPITLIRLYAETLLGRGTFSESQRRGFYGIIMRESDRLAHLVDSVLTFSHIERGDRVYSFEQGDAVPVIARTVADYRGYLERAGFRLHHCLPETGPNVRFDPMALSQAVLNLLDNAVKYSGDSRDISLRLRATDAVLLVEVQDHGIGIPLADQPKVFDRFYRVSNGSGKGGYGLGLFLVRHIMEAHGGTAEVESEPGAGSCFRLVLPVVTA